MSSSTVSSDDNLVVSSEDSSSPDDAPLDLGLGLGVRPRRFGRILTAQDFPSSAAVSDSSTSSFSSAWRRDNGTAAIERTADANSFAASAASPSGQIVGWPPIRAYRMNSMVNQARSLATEEFNSMAEKNKSNNTVLKKPKNGSNMINSNVKGRASLFVKVNMDRIPIGRKVDLDAHGCYESLAQTLEDMFFGPTTTISTLRSSALESKIMADTTRQSKLLNGSSEFVLTYEDKEGDWMLVGDVPWGMFRNSVKRLKIMKTSEATGLGKESS